MSFWDVIGFCQDESGERFRLGRVVVKGDDEQEAEGAAWKELWDSRLTSAGCLFRVWATEFEMNPGASVATQDGHQGLIGDDDPCDLGAGEGYSYPVVFETDDGSKIIEYYPDYELTPLASAEALEEL